MIEPTLSWYEATINAISKLRNEYQINRGMLLTEGDLECHLFNKLLQEDRLSGYHNSKNDSFFNSGNGSELKTSFVHSQVTWFKPGKKSGFEVDLTIGKPSDLEVINIELFEEWTSKGFAYDGPCIAIEIKFIRDKSKAKTYGQEDYIKFRDILIPAKLENIAKEKYVKSNNENIAFLCVIGCKNKEIFDIAKQYLGKHLADVRKPCPNNLFVCIFYQDEIIWDKNILIGDYHRNMLR
ncbi:hypothetical protein [Chryseobacterium sp.]|uniref:hypothetical protein n=1 Tax=Chryseobacterium sp. TaxID=1871047 RepID=UPI0035C6C86A